MSRITSRMGIMPSLLMGAGLFALGVLALNRIVNSMWPFDVARLELVRATAQQRVDAAMLLAAANNEVVIAFLASLVVAITGFALPFAYLINKRFSTTLQPGEQPSLMVVVRQSLWVGLWVAFCVWLQMNRTLGLAVAGLVAGVLILSELLLQLRARASAVQQQHITSS